MTKNHFNIILSVVALMISHALLAQTPSGINYQAVARDANGDIMANESISVRAIIATGSTGSNVEYTETHSVNTNDYGLFNIIIGQGSSSNNFGSLDWGNKKHHLKIELDAGSGFVAMGTVAFEAVPYALSARNVENLPSISMGDLSDVSSSAATSGQVLEWDGTEWKPVTPAGGSSYTAGNGITITGGTIAATSNNAIWNANKLNGNSIAGASPASGEILKWNGTAWAPAADATGSTYTGGTGISITGTTINASNTTNLWNANQLQGTGIATTSPTSGQVLGYNGTSWTPTTLAAPSTPWSTIGTEYANIYRRVGIGIDSARGALHIQDTITATGQANFASAIVDSRGSTGNTASSFAGWFSVTGRSGYQNTGVRGWAGDTASSTFQGGGATGGRFIAASIGGDNNFGVRADATEGANVRNYAVYAHSRGQGTFNMGIFALSNASSSSTTTNYGIYAWADSASTNYAGYFDGNVSYTGTLSAASDARLKTNIQPLQDALSRVNKLQVSTYHYKNTGTAAKLNLPEGQQIGFIAQDLEKSFPELVATQKHASGAQADAEKAEAVEYKAVNYIGMVPVLTKAIQEQQEYIKLLEQRIADLEAKMNK